MLDRAAVCYFRVGDSRTALKLMEFLLESFPGNADVWGKYAAMKVSAGDNSGAADAYRKALELMPDDTGLLAGLNLVQPFSRNSRYTSRLKAIVKSGKASKAEQILAHTALGRIEERHGNPRAAFYQFSKANGKRPLVEALGGTGWIEEWQAWDRQAAAS